MLTPIKAKSRAITDIKKMPDGLYLYSEAGICRLMPKTPRTVRITYTVRGEFDSEKKPGIVKEAEGAGNADQAPAWSVEESQTDVALLTDELRIVVDRTTGSLSYFDREGKLLLRERDRLSREMEEFKVYRVDGDAAIQKEKIETADGTKEVIRAAQKIYAGTLFHTRLNLQFQPDEMLFGLGQHEEGMWNLRGQTVYLHQANRKISVPMLLSSLGYGILTDTYSPMIFSDTAYASCLYTEADSEMDHYFIWGDGMEGVVKEYRKLTGKAAMLPKWAFGYIQSQERYETQEEILAVAKEYQDRNLGLDAIVLDWCSWEDGMWGQKSFDKKRFPDPADMIRKLHEGGVHFMMSIWPNMSEECDNYKEFDEKGLLLAGINIYDALSSEGRALYWKQVSRELWNKGVDAWWCDSSEPVTPEWNRIVKPEPSSMYAEYCQSVENYLPLQLSNAYGLYHAQALYEGQRGEASAADPAGGAQRAADETGSVSSTQCAADETGSVSMEKRVVNLTRSGYTGQQRYGTILWSGDISASWDTFRRQIAAGLQFCASGLPYWTTDIGAFFVKRGLQWFWDGDYDDTNNDPGYRELFVRWYQWGCFLPVFRAHGTDCRRELWAFGDAGEMFYDALAKSNRLRYELMPYIYSQAGKVWLEDASMIKMLGFAFPQDAQALAVQDQYLFGDSMMVCPVTEPMYYEAGAKELKDVPKKRSVYLPKGCGWFDYWTNRWYEGGQWIEADAPLETIPLFIREGSIIPTEHPALHTKESGSRIMLRIYAGSDADYTLYEDAGDGYGYERGEYALTKFHWDDRLQELRTEVTKDCPAGVRRAEISETVILSKK